ncbi:MAG: hypothetical protein AAGB48_08865 [Planctomycetota bacterium]
MTVAGFFDADAAVFVVGAFFAGAFLVGAFFVGAFLVSGFLVVLLVVVFLLADLFADARGAVALLVVFFFETGFLACFLVVFLAVFFVVFLVATWSLLSVSRAGLVPAYRSKTVHIRTQVGKRR